MTRILEKKNMRDEEFERLLGQRARLKGLCRSLTGDSAAAEDLVQETLLEAWRHRDRLRDQQAADAWISGIAHNVCRRWRRQAGLDARREAASAPASESAYGTDAWEELDRAERASLLDRAMGLLPLQARQTLAARYWEELPLAGIAARAGCTENAAAVRLGRAREALRAVLATRLRAEASDFGLFGAQDEAWRETRIWCFRCGRSRLEERQETGRGFGVRCPQCDGAGGEMAFSTGHAAMDAAQVLGPVRACKPALRRVNAWWDTRLRHGLRDRTLPCWRCAGVMRLRPLPGSGVDAAGFGHRATFHCGRCDADFSLPASGLAFHSGPVQRFWQRHPRIRVRPERCLEINRVAVVVTRYEAVGGTAAIEVVYDLGTFRRRQALEEMA